MRDARFPASRVCGGLSDAVVGRQIDSLILPNRAKLLEAAPAELQPLLGSRIEHPADWAAGTRSAT